MKNIYLLILLLIFLYIICNGYIEKFSVGCQSIEKTPINISGSLTLPYINKCNPTPCNTKIVFPTGQGCEWIDLSKDHYADIHDCSKFVTTGKYLCKNGTEPGREGKGFCKNGAMCSGNFNCTNSCKSDEFKNHGKQQCSNYKNICNCVNYQGEKYNCQWTSYW